MSNLCLSFYESLTQPGVFIPPHLAYGIENMPDCEDCRKCTKPWGRAEREQWMLALQNAQTEIEARLSYPVCPKEICNEMHKVDCPIFLRGQSVAYLGKEEFGPPVPLQIFFQDKQGNWPPNCKDCGELDRCPYNYPAITMLDKCQFPEWVTTEDLVFEYLPSDCDRLTTAMRLAQPCLKEMKDKSGEVKGWIATWERYELADPKVNTRGFHDTKSFFCYVQVRWRRINQDRFLVAANDCNCDKCGCLGQCGCGLGSELTYTVGDLLRGQICISGKRCGCPVEYVYANYATGMPDCTDNGSLKEAIVKLAITKLMPDDDICSCDSWKKTVLFWQQIDPSSANGWAKELSYGVMRGAMEAWRITRHEEAKAKGAKRTHVGRLQLVQPERSKKPTWVW